MPTLLINRPTLSHPFFLRGIEIVHRGLADHRMEMLDNAIRYMNVSISIFSSPNHLVVTSFVQIRLVQELVGIVDRAEPRIGACDKRMCRVTLRRARITDIVRADDSCGRITL